jgi:predicted ATP-dependent serine protease
MIQLKGTAKEQWIRQWFNDEFEGTAPKGKVLDIYYRMVNVNKPFEISYSMLNGIIKKVEHEIGQSDGLEGYSVVNSFIQDDQIKGESAVPAKELELNIVRVDEMEFPDFGLFTTGKKIDQLFSDHEEEGGLYGGTVNIVIGESGVGKSTVMLDVLAAIVDRQPAAKILYISSEMTRNDIGFYYRKTPAIGKVPTLLLMDWVKAGQVAQVLEKSFSADYDIILLDSYQDVIVKLKEVHNWKSTKAESWLTNIMIEAAEKLGKSILAIQHMTKGGQYVGSTYLKHATTAMLELRFDISGHRYIEFSKNRRGGSSTGKRLYFTLDQSGQVVYDERRFAEQEEIEQFEAVETIRQRDLSLEFESLFTVDVHSVVE